MRVLEYEAKRLLASEALPVPPGKVVETIEEGRAAALQFGPNVVVKAQVAAGMRMEAGGIHLASSPEEAASAIASLQKSSIYGCPVRRVLVEKRVVARSEYYIGVTYDPVQSTVVFLASTQGGEIVEQNKTFVCRPFSFTRVENGYSAREVAERLGLVGKNLVDFAGILSRLADCFYRWDALLLEANPLLLDLEDHWWFADLHLELDDDAAYRQGALYTCLQESYSLTNERTLFEQRAIKIDHADHRGVAGRLVPFDGDLGLLIGGGGASLTIFDEVLRQGLKPANYCEIGGNPSVWKLKELTKLILSQPNVKRLAVIMNIVNNTRVDLVARGVIKGILEMGKEPADVVAVFRIPGSWEEEGRALLNHYGIPLLGREVSIPQAVEAILWRS